MASPKQVDRIKADVDKGMSANEIQKDLQKRHMGMRRTRLLAYVREMKGKKPKAEQYKYIPTKYPAARKRYPQPPRPSMKFRQQVAVYGSVGFESRRVQMGGSGYDLYNATILIWNHPPKKKFLTVGAGELLDNPREYLDYEHDWDVKPEAESL